MDEIESHAPVRCWNCGWTGDAWDAAETTHLWERVEPGDEMPAGDCPECGALVHVVKEPPKDTRAMDAITKLLAEDWDDPIGILADILSAVQTTGRTIPGEIEYA